MNILVAPNSFKECTDSAELADIISSCLFRSPGLNIISKPVSDGGDGFLSVCQKNFGLKKIYYKIPAPFNPGIIRCTVGNNKKNKNLFIESANVLGLKIIPPEKRHPLVLSSRGLGVLLNKILKDVKKGKLEVNKVTIGIGGTGTNDLGIGMLSELGMKLIDKNNSVLEPIPVNFKTAAKILWKKPQFPFRIKLVTDVNNSLLGSEGAALVYGRQKGLTTKEIKIADAGFEHIIRISKKEGIIGGTEFISGAGGGLAAGFQLFLGSELILSDKFVLSSLGINKSKNISIVITAEGRFDTQSFRNKATGTIIKKFSNSAVKIFLICGSIEKKALGLLPENVYPLELSKYFDSKADSIKNYKKGIKLACEEIIKNII
jgi:glycerate kinase